MAESTDVEGIFFFLKCHVESIAMGTGRNRTRTKNAV
jgi:hypothetical protein